MGGEENKETAIKRVCLFRVPQNFPERQASAGLELVTRGIVNARTVGRTPFKGLKSPLGRERGDGSSCQLAVSDHHYILYNRAPGISMERPTGDDSVPQDTPVRT